MLWKYIFIIFLINKVYGHDLSTQIDQILKENLAKYGGQISRVKRDKTSTFYMEKNKVDLPICQNMKGILGNNFWNNHLLSIFYIFNIYIQNSKA